MSLARVPAWSRRQQAAITSLVVGSALCAAKFVAWRMTGSFAVLSDALESVVNVIAAGFAVFATQWGAQPADRDHPYGHGKIELVAAAFEGGLVVSASLAIFWTGIEALIIGPKLARIDLGLLVSGGAGVANLLLGLWLLRVGRAERSPTIVADGHHVLSDVWITAGVLIGLGLVRLTGRAWLDPACALVVGALVVRTGWHLMSEAAQGLLDREQPELLERIVAAFNQSTVPGVTRLHRLHAIGTGGSEVHVDAHVFIPAAWSIRRAHDAAAQVEQQIKEHSGLHGEIVLHLDPHEGVDEAMTATADQPVTMESAIAPGKH